MRMPSRVAVLAVLVAVALPMLGCRAKPGYTKRLPSGKEIRVLSIGKVYFTRSQPALWLNYQTEISIDNVSLLKQEVMEIWPIFKFNVERSGLTNAVISAHEPARGFIVTKDRSYNFVFQKMPDGSWKL